jgi:tetratricopeptide (TPR) repeat protein
VATAGTSGHQASRRVRPKPKPTLGIATALAMCGVLAAVFVLSPPRWLSRRAADRDRRPELATLVDAVGNQRLFAPRLTGGFAYGELQRTPTPPSDAMKKAAADLVRAAAQPDASPRLSGAAGVAHLLTGDVEAAVSALQAALERSPDDAHLMADLAAALIVRGGDRDGTRAAVVAERATDRDPGLAEAWFNRALAFEAMGLSEEAVKAWDQYLQVDDRSGWAAEARPRLPGPH